MSRFKNEDKMPRFLIWLVFVSKVGCFSFLKLASYFTDMMLLVE